MTIGADYTPREWARLGIYGALQEYHGDPKKEQTTAKRVMFALQRYNHDLHGELSTTISLNLVKKSLNPDQGADLADMGEWADWIINSFIKE